MTTDKFFIPFYESIEEFSLPEKFTYPFQYEPHPLCVLAVKQLQQHLRIQTEWEHNFGLDDKQEGSIIGKMFGVLIVKNKNNEIGFLAAFSGKLAGSYHHAKFVPPIFDSLTKDSFLNTGMAALTQINQEIKILEAQDDIDINLQVSHLKEKRKQHSIDLQDKLFDAYHFLNQKGEEKTLRVLFQDYANAHPPSGAGDCAMPKLLQYAFQQEMQPLAIAEFWWGLSPKSDYWKHGHYYPACQQKCAPILAHMLDGIEMDQFTT